MCVGWSGCALDEPAPPSQRAATSVESSDLTTCICPVQALQSDAQPQPTLTTQCLLACSSCGDGFCDVGEPTTCPFDCGPVCGDGVCNNGETSVSCVTDCGPVCGDGVCNGGETKTSCSLDCGPPPTDCGTGACKNAYLVSGAQARARLAWARWCHDHPGPDASGAPLPGWHYLSDTSINAYNTASTALQPYMYPTYFNFVGTPPTWDVPDGAGTSCSVMPTSALNSAMCNAQCIPTPVCGNGLCESGETSSSCSADCGPVCGNGVCESGETASSCAADCGPVCGNGICELRESITCPADCGLTCIIAPCAIVAQ